MLPETKILILTIGSLDKLPGGTSEYNKQDAITSNLPSEASEHLLKKREQVRRWIRNTKVEWQGVPFSKLEYNQNLVCGQDFGGDDERASYFPALRRYEGRFFNTLGREGKGKIFHSKHHILFLSSLYGLLTPFEPIQLHNCPVEINSKPFRIWTEDESLTNILLAYIREHGITRVFNLTAMAAYRNMISWPAIRTEARDKVVHCVGSASAGDNLLIPFGYLMKDFLLNATEDELLSIKLGTKRNAVVQDIWFHEFPSPHSGKPREADRESLDLADMIERYRRGVIRFLDKVEGHRGSKNVLTGERIGHLAQIDRINPDEKTAMYEIVKNRNKVVFYEYKPKPNELEKIDEARQYLANQAKARHWRIPEFQNLLG